MTNEEARSNLEGIKERFSHDYYYSEYWDETRGLDKEDIESIDMSIQALETLDRIEKESVNEALDAENTIKNIISDIENIKIHRYRETETDTGDISASCFRYEVLEIINKYFPFKAESEE